LGEAKIITLVDASALKQEESSAEGGQAILEGHCAGEDVGSQQKQYLKENQPLELIDACARYSSNCSTLLVVHGALSASKLFECTVAASLVGSSVSISLVVEVDVFKIFSWVTHRKHAVTGFLLRTNDEVIHGGKKFGATGIGVVHLLGAAFNGLKHIFLRLLLALFMLLLYTVRGSLIGREIFLRLTPFPFAGTAFIVTLIFRVRGLKSG